MGVTAFILIVSGAGLVWSAVRVRRRWRDSPTRVWLVAPAVLASGMIGATVTIEVQHAMAERFLTERLRDYSGSDVASVECLPVDESWLFWETYLAYVELDSTVAVASYGVCRDVVEFAQSESVREDPSLHHIEALHVFPHEWEHINGELSEAITTCTAAQRVDEFAQSLGATTAQAEHVQQRWFTDVYPFLPDVYLSNSCRDGAVLDLNPDTDVFP